MVSPKGGAGGSARGGVGQAGSGAHRRGGAAQPDARTARRRPPSDPFRLWPGRGNPWVCRGEVEGRENEGGGRLLSPAGMERVWPAAQPRESGPAPPPPNLPNPVSFAPSSRPGNDQPCARRAVRGVSLRLRCAAECGCGWGRERVGPGWGACAHLPGCSRSSLRRRTAPAPAWRQRFRQAGMGCGGREFGARMRRKGGGG